MSIREKLKQWKRFAAGATAAVLCAGLLAGCTGKNPAGSSDGTAAQEDLSATPPSFMMPLTR